MLIACLPWCLMPGPRPGRTGVSWPVPSGFLPQEAGIRQFIDIGAGFPAASNVHEVAQELEPLSRVVYVDNDPVVVSHARALLCTGRRGLRDRG